MGHVRAVCVWLEVDVTLLDEFFLESVHINHPSPRRGICKDRIALIARVVLQVNGSYGFLTLAKSVVAAQSIGSASSQFIH